MEAQKRVNFSTSMNVAFFAGLTNDFTAAGAKSVIKFDKEVTNVGSAYNTSNGRFTATVAATYQFSYTISTGVKVTFSVKNSAKTDLAMTSTLSSASSSSSVAILSLKEGDQVWIEVAPGSVVSGAMQSSFSGFILFDS